MQNPFLGFFRFQHSLSTSSISATSLVAMAYEPAKKLIDHPANIETEFIDGLMDTYPGLQYLDMKVVVRADVYPGPPYDKVAVISGGGSGHEPAHAGFVGEGMLTAAICGKLFKSPTVDAILAGIRAATGPMGCLLIVMNYTGDRWNFGLAAEKAKSEGYKVETVIVGDDCAIPPPLGTAGRRGLAGTILVHKVAGAAAAAGLLLADVAALARYASENVGTMGVVLNPNTIPGTFLMESLRAGKMDLGLGIVTGFGNPYMALRLREGGTVVDVQPVDQVVSHVLKQILSRETNYLRIRTGGKDKVVLMVNGLGGTPLMELMIAAGRAVRQLQADHGLAVDRVYTGSFMSNLDMEGFSISIMRSEPSFLQLLDAETKAPYWPVAVSGNRLIARIPVPIPPSRSTSFVQPQSQPLQLTEQGQLLEAAVVSAANAILNLKDILNEWGSKLGNRECGSTIYKGANAVLGDIKNYHLNDAAETVGEIGSSIRKAMGGTSGLIYSILCQAACAQLKTSSHSDVTSKQWAEALAAAIATVSKYWGAKAGNRTLLDVLIPASSVLEERLNSGDDPFTAFVLSSEAALAGADSTKQMQTQAGWYLNYLTRGLPDPGAMAAATWYRAAAIAVKDKHELIDKEKDEIHT